MTRLEPIHRLPSRLRLRFAPPLPLQLAMGIQDQLAGAWPELSVRVWGLGQGLVVHQRQGSLPEDLVAQLAAQMAELPMDHPPCWRGAAMEALMALAILGWALPVLPGTPFFLMALALRAPRRR